MKYKNWYITAKTLSKDNEKLEAVFTEYENMEKTDPKRAVLKTEIVEFLNELPEIVTKSKEEDVLGKTKVEVSEEVEEDDVEIEAEEPEEAEEDPLDAPVAEKTLVDDFQYTEESIASIKTKEELQKAVQACKDEKEILRRTRLANETWKERKILNKEIWAVERIRNIAKKKLNDIKRAEKLKIKDKKLTQKAIKQNKFCKLYREGYSFSNIMLHSEGIKIEEADTLVDDTVSEECSKIKASFDRDWAAWKDKFINSKLK